MKHLTFFGLLGMASCMVVTSAHAANLIVCQHGRCSTVPSHVNLYPYVDHIKSMLLTAPNGRIDFCEASPKNHLCQASSIRWTTVSDTNQFNMTIPNARINVIGNEVALDYVLEANNSYPRCMFSPLKISVLPNRTLQIVSYVYNCNLLETEPTNIQKILSVDFIDLDHNVIGGSYLIQSGGALSGEAKGYALMQLRDAKTSLPLVAQRYRNQAPRVPIPVIPQQTIVQPPTPLWNDNEDAIFGNWNSGFNVYPPVLASDLAADTEIEDKEGEQLPPQETPVTPEMAPVSQPQEIALEETKQEDSTLKTTPEAEQKVEAEKTEKPVVVVPPVTETVEVKETIKEKPQEPAKAKGFPSISSILDDLLYTLPFDWLDDAQSEEPHSLFDPLPEPQEEPQHEPEPETVKPADSYFQPEKPQIIPVVPQEIILLVPQDPVVAPPTITIPEPKPIVAPESGLTVEPIKPEPAPIPQPEPIKTELQPAPVYEAPQVPEPKENQIDFSQRRQNIFMSCPPKPSKPKKGFWKTISDAAVNMFYFEPPI
ncbi:MAG: hypothetical protein J6Y85_00120 [Alphaproteobacteria bacterium]|nr:hypothetical protein [Alphaproteobacteria bacterium]